MFKMIYDPAGVPLEAWTRTNIPAKVPFHLELYEGHSSKGNARSQRKNYQVRKHHERLRHAVWQHIGFPLPHSYAPHSYALHKQHRWLLLLISIELTVSASTNKLELNKGMARRATTWATIFCPMWRGRELGHISGAQGVVWR